jgi:mRNA-degrading endonuclease RelE of RelBE toxin-antitoxin system
MDEICENPFETYCDITSIINTPGHYRLRIGKCQFLYEVNMKEIFKYLYKADSRGGVYK